MALALFAIIGVAGFTLLDGVLRSQETTDARLARLAQMQRAMLVIASDFDQITGGLTGGGGAVSLQKDDADGDRVIVRYAIADGALTRVVAGPEGERSQRLVDGVQSAAWTFHQRRGGWLPQWPQVAPGGGPVAATLGAAGVATGAGVDAVALDLTLTGFDGRPGATLRRVVSVPLMPAR